MSDISYESAAIFEHQFWLQVLGDHARFILVGLSPKEKGEIKEARKFIRIFDQLLERSRHPLTVPQLAELTREAYDQAKNIRVFKLDLIRQHLVGDIGLQLPPSFINHMVNEVDEYLLVLECLLERKLPPVCHPVHHHLLWLLDAQGHAAAIRDDLNEIEQMLKEQSQCFVKRFKDFYLKAVEMEGFLRTCLKDFPALCRFNLEVEQEILCFKAFLLQIRELVGTNQALGSIAPLIPDHMLREECYYLIKLAQVSQVKMPDCDPTRPRVEDKQIICQ